jgi:hypothetical protein
MVCIPPSTTKQTTGMAQLVRAGSRWLDMYFSSFLRRAISAPYRPVRFRKKIVNQSRQIYDTTFVLPTDCPVIGQQKIGVSVVEGSEFGTRMIDRLVGDILLPADQ